MRKLTPFLSLIMMLLFAALACNMPSLREEALTPETTESVEQTRLAEVAAGADESQAQAPAPAEATPSQTPTVTNTPTVTPTFTPSIPIARVSQNTNCRTGPGTEYDLVYIFMVGDEAEIVARSSVPNYVIIKVPDGSGRKCWLWMQYGEQTGSTDALPEETPPPTPTPAATATPEFAFTLSFDDAIMMCFGKDSVYLRITNTGAMIIESRALSAKDLDTSETITNQTDSFGITSTCPTMPKYTINPGETAYVIAGFTPTIAGHTLNFTVKACHGNGLAEPCLTKSLNVDIPLPSNVSVKENFEPVDSREILERVSELPITTWNYTGGDREGRHIGPMAQDFNELFGVGEYEEYISSVDSYGVALVAIQALSDITSEQAQEIDALEGRNEALQAENEALNLRVSALEAQGDQRSDTRWHAFTPMIVIAALTIALLLFMRSKLKGRRSD